MTTRFRENDRTVLRSRASAACDVILIEDSMALGLLLQSRIKAGTSASVTWVRTYADAVRAIADRRPKLVVTGINLPDAPNGEIMAMLAAADLPTILFTASLNRTVRERFNSPNIIDYFFKDARDTVDQVVATIARFADQLGPPVLIVDDSASGRSMLIELLRHQNYRIFEAGSGTEALRVLAENEDIELVVTDHHMADMDGHELTQRIRATRPAEELRIIGISASSDPYLSAAFLKAGASDFVYRPFVAEEIRYRIESNIAILNHIRNLRFLAERDSLTGLYNRRAFFDRALPLIERMRLAEGKGAIAILDIDHFKRVNDDYGHDAGDKVIRAVAALLDESCRRQAMPARFGGEEFIILFTDGTIADAQARCEDIRKGIAAMRVAHDDALIGATASFGIAAIDPSRCLDQNLNAADEMLYRAKHQGRNRVAIDSGYRRAA